MKDWSVAWRELASLTADMDPDDSRLWEVLQAMHRADAAYKKNDRQAFDSATKDVHRIVNQYA